MKRRVPSSAVTALVIAALTIVPVTQSASSAGASPASTGWSVSASFAPGYQQLSSVACPSTADCYAVGATFAGAAAVVASTDGGSTWVAQAVPTGVASLSKIVCPTTTTCFAVGAAPFGGAIIATTDSGSTWVSQSLPAGIGSLDAISCPDVNSCMASDSSDADLLTTTDGGGLWSESGADGGISALACPSPSICYGVGFDGIFYTSDWGATWTLQSSPDGSLEDVTCVSTTLCVAVGTGFGQDAVDSYSGGTWTEWNPDGTPEDGFPEQGLSSVSCVSSSECYAVDKAGYLAYLSATSTGGYLDFHFNSSNPVGVACLVTGTCIVVGAGPDGATVVDMSPTGSAFGILPGGVVGRLGEVSCPSASTCYGLAAPNSSGPDDLVVTTDGGASWTPLSTLPSDVDPDGISCPTVDQCFVGGLDRVAVTSDGGATWAVYPALDALVISCPSTTTCYASDGLGMASTTDGGATWTTLPSAPGAVHLACPSVATCYASDGENISVTNDSGSTWSSTPVPTDVPQALACPSVTTCYAAGFGGIYRTDNGGTSWTAQDTQDQAVLAIACSSVDTCEAESADGVEADRVEATGDGGATWFNQPLPSGIDYPPGSGYAGFPFQSLACPADGECFAMSTGALGSTILSYRSAVTITTSTLPAAVVGASYSAQISVEGDVTPDSWEVIGGSLPPGLTFASGAISGVPTTAGQYTITILFADSHGDFAHETYSISVSPPHGYWLVGGDGGIFTFGRATFFGSTGNLQLQRPVVGMTPAGDARGYWMVATDGGIFAFGDSKYHGSIPGLGLHPAGSGLAPQLAAPIVAMVASPTGNGYLLVAADGGVFAFGDATFWGSCPQIGGCSGAVVAVIPDQGELGYWVVTSTGHVYPFGNAGQVANGQPGVATITGAAASATGDGYLLVDSHGDVFAYGDAHRIGGPPSGVGTPGNQVVGIVPTSTGQGYWLLGAKGAAYNYGDAPNDGSMAGLPLNAPIVTAAGF